ncbi:MAG: hypothetical protein PW788_10635 [Micavibrio sp.]|nr:hypothetical protein [Micavibrio sp.]
MMIIPWWFYRLAIKIGFLTADEKRKPTIHLNSLVNYQAFPDFSAGFQGCSTIARCIAAQGLLPEFHKENSG